MMISPQISPAAPGRADSPEQIESALRESVRLYTRLRELMREVKQTQQALLAALRRAGSPVNPGALQGKEV